jgi:hypothetical protein
VAESAREHAIQEAIEASATENEALDGSVLVGWVVIAEWVGVNGVRSLVRMDGTAGGSAPPTWQTRGYLHEALFGHWGDVA